MCSVVAYPYLLPVACSVCKDSHDQGVHACAVKRRARTPRCAVRAFCLHLLAASANTSMCGACPLFAFAVKRRA